MNFKKIVDAYKERIIKIRRDLHAIPEVAYTEIKTSAYIQKFLEQEGIPFKSGIAETGVLAVIESGRPGKTLMIRTDIDALAINEATGLTFSSTHEGFMHACGHDGHMAIALITASILNQNKGKFSGTIKVIFQPAEEGPGGAARMIEQGVMENPTVDYSLGCHLWPAVQEGKVGVKNGPLMAAMSRFDISVSGKAGHGALPHLSIDALDTGVQLVNALQRLVSRKNNPIEPAVLTVGTFNSGTSYNIIAGDAKLSGTTRTFEKETWKAWEGMIETVAEGVCNSMGTSFTMRYDLGYPPVVNDNEMAEHVRNSAIQVVGKDAVIEPEKTMSGEDMAFFLEKSKGCFFFLGVGREGGASLHNPSFDFNEDVLLLGVEIYLRTAMTLLANDLEPRSVVQKILD